MSKPRPLRTAAVAGATLAAALAAAGPASAAPAVAGEFAVTGTPNYLAADQAGNIWTPLTGAATNEIAKVAPDGTVTEYDVANLTNAKGITADAQGTMWVTRTNGVARFDPANPAGATPTAIADIADPRAITLGADGNLWTASGDKLVKFSPANPGGFTSQTIAGMGARGITAGGDGSLHIADFGSARIVHVTTTGAVTFTPVGGGPQEVAAGPGTQIGYANPGANPHVFGRISGGAVAGETQMPASDPFGIVMGNDNAYWIARFATHDIGRVTGDGQFTTLPGLSALSGPRYITKGANNTLWVGLETAKKVARITGVEAPAATPTPTTPTQTPTTTPPTAELALAITKFKAFPSSFKKGTRLPALTQSKLGSQLRFSITKPATVRFRFAKGTVGRKVGSSCVRRTRQNASKKRCVYYTAVPGSFTVKPAAAGDYRVRFQGRITAKRSLAPGRYRVTATATGADGKAATPAKATFAIKTS